MVSRHRRLGSGTPCQPGPVVVQRESDPRCRIRQGSALDATGARRLEPRELLGLVGNRDDDEDDALRRHPAIPTGKGWDRERIELHRKRERFAGMHRRKTSLRFGALGEACVGLNGVA